MSAFIHIYGPQPESHSVRLGCPSCGNDKAEILEEHYEWYDSVRTCLERGEVWLGPERAERPFERSWRRKNVEAARKRLRRYREP